MFDKEVVDDTFNFELGDLLTYSGSDYFWVFRVDERFIGSRYSSKAGRSVKHGEPKGLVMKIEKGLTSMENLEKGAIVRFEDLRLSTGKEVDLYHKLRNIHKSKVIEDLKSE